MKAIAKLILILLVSFATNYSYAQKRKKAVFKDKWSVLLTVIEKLSEDDVLLEFGTVKMERIGKIADTSSPVSFKTLKMRESSYLTNGAIEQFVDDSLIVLVNNENKQVIATKKEATKNEVTRPLLLMKSDSLIKLLKRDWEIKEELQREDSLEYVLVKRKGDKDTLSKSIFRIVFVMSTFDFVSCTQEETGVHLIENENVSDYKVQFGEEAVVQKEELSALKKHTALQIRLKGKDRTLKSTAQFKVDHVINAVATQYKLTEYYGNYKLIFID